MKNVRLVSVTVALAMVCSAANAQLGNRIGNAVQRSAERAAERAVTRQTERRVEDAVNNAIDRALDGPESSNTNANTNTQPANTGNANTVSSNQPTPTVAETPAPAQTPQQGGNALEMAYAKNDFVPGDEIIFEDLMDNEVGRVPLYVGFKGRRSRNSHRQWKKSHLQGRQGKRQLHDCSINEGYEKLPARKVHYRNGFVVGIIFLFRSTSGRSRLILTACG